MAIAVLMEFSEITEAQYDAVVADMNLNGKPAPHGIFHVAGRTSAGSWRIVDVWDSAEAFDEFSKSKIRPLTQKHGLTKPPTVDIWPVYNMLK